MRIFTLFCFLFLSSPLFSQSADEYIKLAREKMDRKDYKYALTLSEKAIALNDTDIWSYLLKAEIIYQLYGPLLAIPTVKEAIAINKKQPESYSRAGTYYSSAGLSDSAIMMYDLAIKYAPNGDTSKYYYITNRGAAKLASRDFEGAKTDFLKSLAFNPNDIGTLNNISTTYDELGETGMAIETIKKVIRLDSTFLGGYGNLGFIYSKIDSLDQAIFYFNKALKLGPEDALTFNNRGYAYYKKGSYDKALDDINYSIHLYPQNAYAYRNLALVYIAIKDMDKACSALGYADYYGFEQRYGSEVLELADKYCMKK